MGREFVRRVSGAMLIALALITVGAGLVAGRPAALGALTGGLISLGSFRWIARGVVGAPLSLAGRPLALSGLTVGVRHLVLFGALAVTLASGVAHPIAVLAGLSLLPPIVIAVGLSSTRLAGSPLE